MIKINTFVAFVVIVLWIGMLLTNNLRTDQSALRMVLGIGVGWLVGTTIAQGVEL